jgi:hypothetical protein
LRHCICGRSIRDDHREDQGTDQGEQFILPGAERSARQAAAARGEKMRAWKPQLPPGGLFEAPEVEEPRLFEDW